MLKTIKGVKIKNNRVLLRVDFNVPMKNSEIIDDARIKAVLPTIKYLVKNKAKVIIISHLGKPTQVLAANSAPKNFEVSQNLENDKSWEGKPKGPREEKFSLRPIANYLKVKFFDDCIGNGVKQEIKAMKPGEVILLENLRFYPEEEENDQKFAGQLADLADFYINDAFSVSHRRHASVSAITKYLPSYAGFLLENEIKKLSKALEKPSHPLVAIIGGAKISTKIKVIKNLLRKVDNLLVGGALANNFLKALKYEVGESLIEKEMLGEAKKLLKEQKIILPIDVIVSTGEIKDTKEVGQKDIILDIGPKTRALFSNYLKRAKMIVWNGPLGKFEEKGFAKGTEEIAKAVLNNKKAEIIIGGGETIASLKIKNQKLKIKNKVFISTGGGAMLEFLEGKILPGIKPLMK